MRRMIPLMCIALLILLLGPSAIPKAQAQTPRGVRVGRYGAVNVRQLPAPRPSGRSPRHIPFLVPDAEGFRQEKREANLGGLGVESAPVLAPQPALVSSTSPGFAGITYFDTAGYIPPDSYVAAGPNHLFNAVNANGRILDKTTGADLLDFDLFSLFFVDFFYDVVSDPIVKYDATSGRWFASIVTLSSLLNVGEWRWAISQTGDPAGTYDVYYAQLQGAFPDFPKLAVTNDKLVLTGDAYTIFSQAFQGTMFLVFDKAPFLGTPPALGTYQFFPPPQGLLTIQPATPLSPTSTLYMASVGAGRRASALRLWTVTGVPPNVTFTTRDLSIAALKTPPDALQAGTTVKIQTNDTRLLDAMYRDGLIWVTSNTGCRPGADKTTRSCARFIQINPVTPAVLQDFSFGEPGTYYYYPAIQTDGSNNLLAVLNRSSTSEFASVYASGRLTTDPLNTLQAPVLLHGGVGPYTPFANRWGDYSGASIDPAEAASVWVAGEFAFPVGDGSGWGTWIAKIRF